MSIPELPSVTLSLLKLAEDQREHAIRDAIDSLANQFQLSDQEREELLPSGSSTIFGNRVHWASTRLRHSLLLESTKRGFFKITSRGVQVVQQNPIAIDHRFLVQFPEYVQFLKKSSKKDKNEVSEVGEAELEATSKQTPEELLEDAYQQIRQDLAQEVLSRVKSCSAAFFERLVVELLVKMGYGGSRQDAGKTVGRSGDGGIDGTIKEDRLGLDVIYIQAKKWEGCVGRPEIQKFAGALQGQRARKGIFITTSYFSDDARKYVEYIDSRIVLIDGKQLAEFMIDHNVGLSKVSIYEIKKIDTDYFTEA